MNPLKFPSFILAVILMAACSKSSDEGVSDKALTGTVAGQSFTFKGGKADYNSESEKEEGLIWLHLTNVVVGCESDVLAYDLSISARVSNIVGEQNYINIITNSDEETPFNSLGNSIEITNVSDTEISGKMKLTLEESTIVKESIFEGSFTLPICE